MKSNDTPKLQPGRASPARPAPRGSAASFEELLAAEASDEQATQDLAQQVMTATRPLAARLGQLEESVAHLPEELSGIRKELERLKTDDRVLTEMHNRCQELAEQHYERQILRPLLLGVIGMIDRSQGDVAKLSGLLAQYADHGNGAALRAIEYLRGAISANCIDMESFLANYAVESFRCEGEKFDPSSQRCLRPVECDDPALEGTIAKRRLPGYRRDGQILRPEVVEVHKITPTTPRKGQEK